MPEGDRAAVDVHLGRIKSQLARDGDRLRGKGLVQLEEIDVAGLQPCALEHLAHRRHRADAHHLRIDAGRHVRQDPRQRLRSQRLCFLGRRDDEGSGAVVDAGGVAGGHRAVLLERRLQRAEFLRGRSCSRELVRVDQDRLPFALRNRHRHDLLFETALGNRAHCSCLTLSGERILIRARHVVARRHLFRSDAHMRQADRAGQPLVEHRVDDLAVPHAVAPARPFQQIRRIGHRLGPARHDRVHVADANRLDRVHDRLKSGTAHPVDRLAGHLDRQPGFQARLPRDVHAVARLQHAAHDRVPDVRRWDAGSADRLANDECSQIYRADVFKSAAERADRCSARAENDNLELLIHPEIIVLRSCSV